MFHRKGSKTSKKGRGSSAPTNTKAVQRDENPRLPPPLLDQLSVGFTLRFVTTASWPGSITVTYQNLLDAWFVAGTATTAYELFDFVRVKKVTVRAMGTANPVSAIAIMPQATVGVEFPGLVGGQFGSGKQKMGSGVGYDEPAFVSLRPDPMSQSAQFQPSTSNPAFIVRAVDGQRVAVEGAVIDVSVVFKNSGDISPAALGTARAGLTPGNLYFGGIDGLATSNTVAKSSFIPIA